MSLQPIFDIAEVCAQRGVVESILCPGSRCAPLTIAFSRHPKIKTRTISDERSAGFIGLGIAQQMKSPTVLVCTSGSAAYNFAPAVAEAFFQQIPLLIFTADRPAEWIDQLDGQTIRQHSIFGQHVKKSYHLPADHSNKDSQWHINRSVNEAITLASEYPAGPVHINIPFREPFYPKKGDVIQFNSEVRIISESIGRPVLDVSEIKKLSETISSFSKVLIVPGQGDYDEALIKAVEQFNRQNHAAVVNDIISNFHSYSNAINHADAFLGQCGSDVKESLRPELLITFGKSIISKNVKQFLRVYTPKEHWHIQSSGVAADTYQHLTRLVRSSPELFFRELYNSVSEISFEVQKRKNYTKLWEAEDHRNSRSINNFFKEESFDEFSIIEKIVKSLPPRCNLHLANSMSVRYANLVGLEADKKGIHVYANRGTSGIDGCTSTAFGHALVSDVPNFLITGDLAFFYDRNAFWNNYAVPNLHILLINNHGGIIFNLIDGPSDLPEQKEYFITEQKLSAEHLAKEFGFAYFKLDTAKKIKNAVLDFFTFDGKTKILEVECASEISKLQFEKFKQQIKKGYEA